MTLATYSDLLAGISDWMVRSNLTRAADCVRLFEEEFNNELRLRPMQARVTNAAVSSEYGTVPDDFLSEVSLAVVDGRPLQPATVAELDEFAACNDVRRRPTHYAVVGNAFRYWPVPDTDYTVKLTYHQKVPALSDAAPTNWLLEQASGVYLYGSLVHAAPYLRDQAAEATFERRFTKAKAALRAASRQRGGVLRTELGALLARNHDPSEGWR